MIRFPVIACLAITAAAHAIGPGDLPSAGPVVNGASNADFVTALSTLGSLYYNSTGTPTAGVGFSNVNGLLPQIGGQDAGVRVWFGSQNAGYTNSLGVVEVGTPFSLTASTIFANSHTAAPGQYVDLNGGNAIHDYLSFFSLANIDTSGDAHLFWFQPTLFNVDGQSHIQMSAPYSYAGSLWYALALDDECGGGDRDWNDLRVIIQLHPVAAPEPATLALFAGFLGLGLWIARRRRALLAA